MRLAIFAFFLLSVAACSRQDDQASNARMYASYSRVTDPRDLDSLLANLPDDVDGICAIAKQQTIHHNLMGYFDIPRDTFQRMSRIWPPRMPVILQTLAASGPKSLSPDRLPEDRIIGACVLESHFLAGMLRSKGIPVRVRAGYFKNVNADREHTVTFWENALKRRGVMGNILKEDSLRWKEIVEGFTNKQIDIDHHIEHWVCEYWNAEKGAWEFRDANNTFLKAHSKIDVGFELTRDHFEPAYVSWKYMRTTPDFNPDQYAEEPQDGRSHIRSQLLWDFYSLLNHDISGYDRAKGEEGSVSKMEEAAFNFIKKRTYDELSEKELAELDALAELISRYPSVDQLVEFYRNSETLHLENADNDSYSFVYNGK